MNSDKRVQLVSELINDRLKKRGMRASDVAQRAKIHPTTFSNIRNGNRRVSRETVQAIARALSPSSEEEEHEINEFLIAAGFSPQTLSQRTPLLVELLSEDAVLKIESSLKRGDQVWVLSRLILETFQKRLLAVVCENLKKEVEYTYFISRSHALNWVMFDQQLREHDVSVTDRLVNGYVLPDECFRSEDPKIVEFIYRADSAENFQVFRTSKAIEGEYLYSEENKWDAADTREYLKKIRAAAEDGAEPPCAVIDYLNNTHGEDLVQKLFADIRENP